MTHSNDALSLRKQHDDMLLSVLFTHYHPDVVGCRCEYCLFDIKCSLDVMAKINKAIRDLEETDALIRP